MWLKVLVKVEALYSFVLAFNNKCCRNNCGVDYYGGPPTSQSGIDQRCQLALLCIKPIVYINSLQDGSLPSL